MPWWCVCGMGWEHHLVCRSYIVKFMICYRNVASPALLCCTYHFGVARMHCSGSYSAHNHDMSCQWESWQIFMQRFQVVKREKSSFCPSEIRRLRRLCETEMIILWWGCQNDMTTPKQSHSTADCCHVPDQTLSVVVGRMRWPMLGDFQNANPGDVVELWVYYCMNNGQGNSDLHPRKKSSYCWVVLRYWDFNFNYPKREDRKIVFEQRMTWILFA